MRSGKVVSGRKRILSWVFLLVSASVPVCAQYLWMPERFTLFQVLLFFKCLYLCLVVAKRLYCEWSRSVSASQCPRGMPWACSVGLVENGQRAPSECKGGLQDCQVSFTLTLPPIVRTKSPLNWMAFDLLQIFLMNKVFGFFLFQLQIMPPQVASHRHTEAKPPGSLPDQKHPEAFLEEARQLLSRWIQLEAEVSYRTEWHRTHAGERNLPSESLRRTPEVDLFSGARHWGKWHSDQ